MIDNDAMTQNGGAMMYDTAAPIYEADDFGDEPNLVNCTWIVWAERWVDMTLSTTKFQRFLMR
jgi:hypothetical protein